MPKRSPTNAGATRLVEPLLREPVLRWVLPNGLVVLVRPDDSIGVASVQVWIRSGSIHEAPRLGSGVSHYLEHMMFKGTPRRAGREISATVQEHGGYINAYTAYDRTVYYIDVPSEHVGVALDVLADAVFHSTLPAEEVTKERDVILREIGMGLDDPDYRVGQGLMEAAFREHPYRYPIIGHREVFARLGRDDLVDYHAARYVPNNAALVVAGSVEPEALRALVEQHFGGLPRARIAPVLVPDEPGQLAPRRVDLEHDVQVFRAAAGYQVPGLAHPDTPALDVLSLVLGHGDSSVLWQTIREKRKLVHQVDATNWNPGSKGLFYISLVGDTDKGDRALEAVDAEIERVREGGVSHAQLDKAIRQALVSEINVRRTISGQASRLGVAEVVAGDLAYPATYLERLSHLTVADLQRVARDYLRPENLTTATLRPPGAGRTTVSATAGRSSLDFDEKRLANGAQLLWRENHRLPQVHLRVVWQGGPACEAPGHRGATALLSTLLTLDTAKRSAAQVARVVESVGGTFSEFSGNNSFGFALEVLPDDLDLALDLLEQAILHPAFKPATLAREREAQIAEVTEENDDIVTSARRRLRQVFFDTHPLASESAGTPDTIVNIDRDVVHRLYRALVVAGNTVLAVSGDFRAKELLPRLERLLKRLPKGERPRIDLPFDGPPRPGEIAEPSERQQVVVYQGYPGVGLLDPDFYVSEVMDELFSGMSSNLFERVREEKSLAYFVRSARVIGLRAGLFFLVAGTHGEGCREVVAEFEAELKRVRAGRFLPGELDRCRTRLKAARRMSMQSNAACAAQAALNGTYGLPVNDWRHYDSYIDAVTAADLKRFAREHFVTKQSVRLLAGALRSGASA